MVGVFLILNEENKNRVPYNETAILKTIKKLDGRDGTLRDYYINMWENLMGKKFNKKYLELL